jgi:hypothetical protein
MKVEIETEEYNKIMELLNKALHPEVRFDIYDFNNQAYSNEQIISMLRFDAIMSSQVAIFEIQEKLKKYGDKKC